MLVVFGKPIELPKTEHPSKEEIQKYLQLYINAMQALCQKHKDGAGYGGTTFKVVWESSNTVQSMGNILLCIKVVTKKTDRVFA